MFCLCKTSIRFFQPLNTVLIILIKYTVKVLFKLFKVKAFQKNFCFFIIEAKIDQPLSCLNQCNLALCNSTRLNGVFLNRCVSYYFFILRSFNKKQHHSISLHATLNFPACVCHPSQIDIISDLETMRYSEVVILYQVVITFFWFFVFHSIFFIVYSLFDFFR